MRGKARVKVVSSGRLTGAVRGRGAASHPAAASRPEAAYSLYSTDSEDQVTSLHRGLDRCAALLHGMLQADQSASRGPPRTAGGGAVRPRLSTPGGKKALRKRPPRADLRSAQPGHCGPGAGPPRVHRSTAPQVKPHPPQEQCVAQLQSHLHPTQTSAPPPRPEASVLLSVRQSSSLSQQPPLQQADQPGEEEEEEQECVPVRDVDTQSPATHTHTCSPKSLRLQPAQAETLPGDGAEAGSRADSVQHLLGEPEALRAARARGLQEQLEAAQHHLTELRDALQEARSRLREREAENAVLRTELQATRSRLVHSEQQRSRLASLAEQRLKEIGHLNSLLQSRLSLESLTVSDAGQQQHPLDPRAPPPSTAPALQYNPVLQYLKSLGESVHTADSRLDATAQGGVGTPEAHRQPPHCDTESVWSDWSTKSGLTFDTRDEAAFRDGLEALDASIASLQKTIQLELKS